MDGEVLKARVECLKLAAAICGSDRSAENVAQTATTLYAWVVGDGAGDTALPSSAERNPAPSPATRRPKDKAKAP